MPRHALLVPYLLLVSGLGCEGAGHTHDAGGMESGTGAEDGDETSGVSSDTDTTMGSGGTGAGTSGASAPDDDGSSDAPDASDDGPGPHVPVAPCPSYSGLGNVGSSWTTRTTAAYEAQHGFVQQTERQVTNVQLGSPTRVTVVSTSSSSSTTSDYQATSVTTMTYACDDEGAWLETLHSQTDGVTNGTPFSAWSDTTYSPPMWAMPWDVDVGTTWTTTSTLMTNSANGPTQTPMMQSYEVVGAETVTAPAGTFDVLRFMWSSGMSSGSWVAHTDVGGIAAADGAYELVNANIVPW